jgi:regulation of enolase protein 1 (concanavalin A-like superfamily)
MTRRVGWDEGRWTTPPVEVARDGDALIVTAAEGSDAWRVTSYGFVHDNEHALLLPLAPDTAVEVEFDVTMNGEFDQAGLFLRASATRWTKAGIEFADGMVNLGAVVTDERSDWSSAPMPHWAGRRATVRASRSGDAVTVRAGVDDEPLRLVRLFPLDPEIALEAGPYLCAPTRAGLTVRFHRWELTDPDASLH